jgi:hypothetical protein
LTRGGVFDRGPPAPNLGDEDFEEPGGRLRDRDIESDGSKTLI